MDADRSMKMRRLEREEAVRRARQRVDKVSEQAFNQDEKRGDDELPAEAEKKGALYEYFVQLHQSYHRRQKRLKRRGARRRSYDLEARVSALEESENSRPHSHLVTSHQNTTQLIESTDPMRTTKDLPQASAHNPSGDLIHIDKMSV